MTLKRETWLLSRIIFFRIIEWSWLGTSICCTCTCNQRITGPAPETAIYGGSDRTSIVWQRLCHILFQRRTVAVSVATGNNSIAFPFGRKQWMQSCHTISLLLGLAHTADISHKRFFYCLAVIVCWMGNGLQKPAKHSSHIIPGGGMTIVSLLGRTIM